MTIHIDAQLCWLRYRYTDEKVTREMRALDDEKESDTNLNYLQNKTDGPFSMNWVNIFSNKKDDTENEEEASIAPIHVFDCFNFWIWYANLYSISNLRHFFGQNVSHDVDAFRFGFWCRRCGQKDFQ